MFFQTPDNKMNSSQANIKFNNTSSSTSSYSPLYNHHSLEASRENFTCNIEKDLQDDSFFSVTSDLNDSGVKYELKKSKLIT